MYEQVSHALLNDILDRLAPAPAPTPASPRRGD